MFNRGVLYLNWVKKSTIKLSPVNLKYLSWNGTGSETWLSSNKNRDPSLITYYMTGSSVPYYIVSYNIKWVTTSWTYSRNMCCCTVAPRAAWWRAPRSRTTAWCPTRPTLPALWRRWERAWGNIAANKCIDYKNATALELNKCLQQIKLQVLKFQNTYDLI